jgi:hypothetical protein
MNSFGHEDLGANESAYECKSDAKEEVLVGSDELNSFAEDSFVFGGLRHWQGFL